MKAAVVKEPKSAIQMEDRKRPKPGHGVKPRLSRYSLEDAGKALDDMHEGRLHGRAVLVMD